MNKKHRFIPLINSILVTVFLILTEFIEKLESFISLTTDLEQESTLVTSISGISLIIVLWAISRLSLFVYDKIFFQMFGLGGSKRGTYMYLALQKMLVDDSSEFEVKSNNHKVVRIFGIFFLDDKPEESVINYAEAFYWNGLKKFERRGSWSSHHIRTDDTNKIELIYEIKVDCNEHGKTIPEISTWRGAFNMQRQVLGDSEKSLVMGKEAWRGVAEGKNFESAFYCERLTLNSFWPAEKVHKMIIDGKLSKKLSSKLPL